MSTKTRAKITSFQVISTNKNPIIVDGILTEDILSIIHNTIDKYGLEKWKELIDFFYKHIVDYDNPHKFITEQLDMSLIDVIYNQWIHEGYTGSKEEFINIFFQHIKLCDITDDDIIDAGTAEDVIPVIAVLAKINEKHNNSLQAHSNLFNMLIDYDNDNVLNHPTTFSVTSLSGFGLRHYKRYVDKVTGVCTYPITDIYKIGKTGTFMLQGQPGTEVTAPTNVLWAIFPKNPSTQDTLFLYLGYNSEKFYIQTNSHNDKQTIQTHIFDYDNNGLFNLALSFKKDKLILRTDTLETFIQYNFEPNICNESYILNMNIPQIPNFKYPDQAILMNCYYIPYEISQLQTNQFFTTNKILPPKE